ncbi:MAG: IS30 family transposase [Saprospiraceae bacterium]|nr:IS30 family transposase [Saprospiraceae bacterium]
MVEKIEHKNAKYINSKIKSILNRTEKPIRSITTDNDLAFANHHQLNIDVYFTNPYSSQEKGSVENRIGQLRRFFPKRTNFDEVSESQINKVEHLLNNRPLKMFNYKTPNEVYFSNTLALMN